MGHCFMIFVAAFIFHLGISSQASSIVSKGERARDTHVQIHVHADSHIDHNPSLLEVVESIQKERVQRIKQKGLVMRSEVQKHFIPLDNAGTDRAQPPAEKNVGLLELKQVDCSSVTNVDNITRKLCSILEGASNAEIAGKLERAVKGLSLKTNSSNHTEVMISHGQDVLLRNLRSALWDLWFCAKRTDCDVSHSQEPKIMAAREQAFEALQAMRTHLLSTAVPDSAKTDAHTSALIERVSTEQVPAASASEWAQSTVAGLLSPGNVTGKLWDAIHTCNLNDVDMKDIVSVSKDQDVNFKKLRDAMLIIHECAQMPDCPTTSGECCDPKNPEQPRFKDARDEAYMAYHQIQEDGGISQQAYADMLRNIAVPGDSTDTSTTATLEPSTTTLYPPGHPNAGTLPPATTTKPVVKEAVPEGNVLLGAICGVGGFVVLLTGFLIFKSYEKPGAKTGGEESWEGEKW